jgi:hypothetical protein
MALIKSQEPNKVQPCVCGREKRKSLYRSHEMSPDTGDVAIGTAVFLGIEIVLPVFLIWSGAAVLSPFVAIPIPAIIVVLFLKRLLSGHSMYCSVRWAYIATVGAARFLSF